MTPLPSGNLLLALSYNRNSHAYYCVSMLFVYTRVVKIPSVYDHFVITLSNH